jgi:hypothetical protein
LEKHRVFAVGPELSFLQGGVVRRGLFEFDARNQFDGFVILANRAAPFDPAKTPPTIVSLALTFTVPDVGSRPFEVFRARDKH